MRYLTPTRFGMEESLKNEPDMSVFRTLQKLRKTLIALGK
jgi:hypothetical protein